VTGSWCREEEAAMKEKNLVARGNGEGAIVGEVKKDFSSN